MGILDFLKKSPLLWSGIVAGVVSIIGINELTYFTETNDFGIFIKFGLVTLLFVLIFFLIVEGKVWR